MKKKYYSYKNANFCVLLIWITLSLCVPSVHSETIKWPMHSQFIESNFVVRDILKPFVAEVYKRTNGRLDITLHHSKELGYSGGDMMRHLRNGVIPISEIIVSFTAGDLPLVLGFELPFLQRNDAESRLFFSTIRPYMAEAYKNDWNQYLLLNGPFPFTGVFTRDKPINTLDDLKGLKVRTLGKMSSEAFKSLNATPVYIEFTEVYMALKRGTADAAQTSATTAADAKLWEVTKFFTQLYLTRTSWAISVNKQAADSLPPDIRKILFEVASEFEQKMFDISLKAESDAAGVMASNGQKFYEISPGLMEECSNITRYKWHEWADTVGNDGKNILNTFLEKTGRSELKR